MDFIYHKSNADPCCTKLVAFTCSTYVTCIRHSYPVIKNDRQKKKETGEKKGISKNDEGKKKIRGMMPLNLFCLKENNPAVSECLDTHYQQYMTFWADQCHGSVLYKVVWLGPDPAKHLD